MSLLQACIRHLVMPNPRHTIRTCVHIAQFIDACICETQCPCLSSTSLRWRSFIFSASKNKIFVHRFPSLKVPFSALHASSSTPVEKFHEVGPWKYLPVTGLFHHSDLPFFGTSFADLSLVKSRSANWSRSLMSFSIFVLPLFNH